MRASPGPVRPGRGRHRRRPDLVEPRAGRAVRGRGPPHPRTAPASAGVLVL